ncbi:MAG: hypothetical protein HWE25_12610 [Alphaproteobacteria bacterium]|nr:hypothetical protein [Alphaproteobacteria bacterium]
MANGKKEADPNPLDQGHSHAWAKETQSRLAGTARHHQRLAVGYIMLALVLAVGGILYFSDKGTDDELELRAALTEWELKDAKAAELLLEKDAELEKVSIASGLLRVPESCEPIRMKSNFDPFIDKSANPAKPRMWKFPKTGMLFSDLTQWRFEEDNSPTSATSGPIESKILISTCGPMPDLDEAAKLYKESALRNLENPTYYSAYNPETGLVDKDHPSFKRDVQSDRRLTYEAGTMLSALRSEFEAVSRSLKDEIETTQEEKATQFQAIVLPLQQKLAEPPAKPTEYDIVNEVVVRVGSISLALYLLALFLGFARYHTRMANFYETRGHALVAASVLAPETVGEILKSLDPEKIMFNKEPSMPLDKIIKIAEAFKK